MAKPVKAPAAGDTKKRKIPVPEGIKPLTREEILSADDIRGEWVEVPEWTTETGASHVYVEGLDGVGRDRFERSIVRGDGANREVVWDNMRAKLVQRCTKDPEDGLLLFSPDDIEALGLKSGAALQRVFGTAARLSGITPEEQRALVENLEQTDGEDSSTGSPSVSDAESESSSSG